MPLPIPSGPPADDGYAPSKITNMTIVNDSNGNPVQVTEYFEGGSTHVTNITYLTQT